MRRSRLRRTLFVIGALTLGLTVPATSGAQGSEPILVDEVSMTATVTEVLVNSAGGIKVSGTLACPDATADFEQAVLETPEVKAWEQASPGGTVEVTLTGLYEGMVPVSPNFTATQYLGRTKVITAKYESGIARWCRPWAEAEPYEWYTLYPYPVGGVQWIYSSTGRFSAGSIHIEMKPVGEITAVANGTIAGQQVEIATFTRMVYGFSDWDLRAQKVRR